MEKYNHLKIEKKWQKYWEDNKSNFCDLTNDSKIKFYNLVMFYYPSGDKIHIGHGYNFTGSDVFGRYKKMQGFNVFQPMGADAFGLPAENYAIKTGVHPAESTKKNIEYSKHQLKKLGLMYDWEKEIDTSSSEYYKWTQWIFSVLYKAGLAYQAKAPVNWCPSCKTVLANEQVVSGKCERCDSEVIQKNLKQWFFKITDYADRLLKDHEKIDWPQQTITMQKNWIGKSTGAEVNFKIKSSNEVLNVFTTRPDTLFGATFVVVAPEHSLIKNNEDSIENLEEIKEYIKQAKKKSDLERGDLNKDKSGVELKGIKTINPVNNQEIPIFVADYVMMSYGTGAIMAVPAHDERDWEFAKKYDLKITEVIKGGDVNKEAFIEIDSGEMVNSEFLDGMKPKDAIDKISNWLKEKGLGEKAINYKLRDWLISRQRYWGAPIPIIYCDKCGEVLDENLPVQLPELKDFKPTSEGESPLARSEGFVNVKCPKCGIDAKRSTETMDTFVCSSWYFLRYISPNLNNVPFDKKLTEKWLPVDQYCGGAEHSVMHLLYARFVTKVLFDQGYIKFDEPFKKLNHQGMILAEDGQKMSKSKGNSVIPDDYIKNYGADIFRTYVLFLAPFEQGGSWSDKGILGVDRFLEKVHLFFERVKVRSEEIDDIVLQEKDFEDNQKLDVLINKTIKKVTEDIEGFKFNTAISAMMVFINESKTLRLVDFAKEKKIFEKFLILLSPFAPHITEELWHELDKDDRKDKSIFNEKWPEYDKNLIQADEIELVVQVNGKVRDKIMIAAGISEDEAKKIALGSERIGKWLEGKEPKKIIFIQGKLVSIVV